MLYRHVLCLPHDSMPFRLRVYQTWLHESSRPGSRDSERRREFLRNLCPFCPMGDMFGQRMEFMLYSVTGGFFTCDPLQPREALGP